MREQGQAFVDFLRAAGITAEPIAATATLGRQRPGGGQDQIVFDKLLVVFSPSDIDRITAALRG